MEYKNTKEMKESFKIISSLAMTILLLLILLNEEQKKEDEEDTRAFSFGLSSR